MQHAQHDHISSREHARLKSCKLKDCTSVRPQNNCHPRVMSHSLPHLTLTTSTSSLSPAHTRSMVLDPYFPCDVPRQSGGSTQIASLTGCEPKSIETKVVETEAIEPEDLRAQKNWAWKESWDRSVSNTGKINEKLSLKMWMNLEKLV